MASTNIIDVQIASWDQLQWVKFVPKVSSVLIDDDGSALFSSIVPREIWWPCLVFHDYLEFESFFQDELTIADDGDR